MWTNPGPEWQKLEHRLTDWGEALDGYPVAALADLCGHADSPERVLALADQLISAWVAHLSHDIELVQTPAPDALARARQRMVDTRDALVSVQSLFSTFRQPCNAAECGVRHGPFAHTVVSSPEKRTAFAAWH